MQKGSTIAKKIFHFGGFVLGKILNERVMQNLEINDSDPNEARDRPQPEESPNVVLLQKTTTKVAKLTKESNEAGSDAEAGKLYSLLEVARSVCVVCYTRMSDIDFMEKFSNLLLKLSGWVESAAFMTRGGEPGKPCGPPREPEEDSSYSRVIETTFKACLLHVSYKRTMREAGPELVGGLLALLRTLSEYISEYVLKSRMERARVLHAHGLKAENGSGKPQTDFF